jgi:hypothetical protein
MCKGQEFTMKSGSILRGVAVAAALLSLIVLSVAAVAHEGREVGGYRLTVGFLSEPAYEGEPNGVSVRIVEVAEAGTSHGALFNQVISPGSTFEFKFEHELEGESIGYHAHGSGSSDFHGVVKVTSSAPEAGMVRVEITGGRFVPAEVMVRPDTTVMWENKGDMAVTLMNDEAMDHMHDTPTPAPVTGIAESLKVEVTHIPTNTTKSMALREAFGQPGHYVSNFIPTAPGAYRFHFTGEIHGMKLDETFTSGRDTFNDVEAAREVQFPLQLGSSREIESAVRGVQDSANSAQESIGEVQSTADSARTLAITGLVIGAAGLVSGALGLTMALRRK